MKTEKFTCMRDGLTIRGLIYLPEGDHLPIAVISHGFMATYQTTKQYAKWFAKRGYAAFCFDFNGGGIGCRSDKDTTKMTVLTEDKDLKVVIACAKELPETDEKSITLMGCSQGGYVSAMVSSELPDMIKRLILFYPAFCIPDDARSGQMMMAKFDPDHLPETFWCGPMKLGKCYPEAVMNVHFEEMISPYEGPVLIVHGDQDKIVSLSYAEKAAEVYKDAKLVVLPGAGHGFKKRDDVPALKAVEEFIR